MLHSRAFPMILVLLMVGLMSFPVPASSAAITDWNEFDRILPGSFLAVGNTVLRCPPGGHAYACRRSEQGKPTGPDGLNDNNSMVFTNPGVRQGTFDSSDTRVWLPAGAHVVHALLSWAGDVPAGSTGRCGRTASWPHGSPARQSVLLSAAGRTTTVPARHFLAQPVRPGADRWYSAYSEVTAALSGLRGPANVNVGNVWTGQGYDCFGGWSLVLVYSVQGSPVNRVIVYPADREIPPPAPVTVRAPGLAVGEGRSRLAVIAYEGDRGIAGDSLAVNGRALPPVDNFFVSHAAGAIFPSHVNSMGVDATTVTLPPGVPRRGPVRISAHSTQDGVLLGAFVISVPQPRPHLAVRTATEDPLAHEGQPITQDATVTNTGEVPLVRVQVDLGPCHRSLGTLGPGRSSAVSCPRTAAATITARATGIAPVGTPIHAEASATIQLVHPALGLRAVATPRTVLAGRPVGYRVRIANTGDVALTNVLLTASAPCSPAPREQKQGQSVLLRCAAIASAVRPAARFAAVGTDPLGLRVSAAANAVGTVRAPAVPVPPPATAPPATQPPATQPQPRAPSPPKPSAPAHSVPPPPPMDVAQAGPMSEPAATAAVIAVLGVFVMTVSVGAYAAAFRNK